MSTLDKIQYLLSEKGKKQKDLTDFLGISKNAFTDWKSGRIKSWHKYLPRIAEYFGVSVDYLLGRENNAYNATVSGNQNVVQQGTVENCPVTFDSVALSENEQEFIRIYRSLSPKDKNKLMSIVFDFEK